MREFIKKNKINIASLAPSFPVYFEEIHPLQLVTALKKIGFTYVEETVTVLPEVVELRKKAVKVLNKPLISESCPRIIKLVSNEFPELIENLAPVPSPMELHGKTIKEKYGIDCNSVFISPCQFKKEENAQKKLFDQTITFRRLMEVFKELDYELTELPLTPFDADSSSASKIAVLHTNIDGLEKSRTFLKTFKEKREPLFYEITACENGCIEAARRNKNSCLPSFRLIKAWEEFL